ncbi:MAG: glycosyltransferase family 4 protein [Desulfomonilaceae bacterium]
MLDIAVIIPELSRYGGAQRFVLECVARWQHTHKVTLYAAGFAGQLLEEHGISDKVRLKTISPLMEGLHALVYNSTILPRKWELEIGKHDVYQTHLWPTHLINRHPMVWYPHEPLRILYDLCGWDRPIPVYDASELKNESDWISPTSRAQCYPPGLDSQVLCGCVAEWSGFRDSLKGQVAALPMAYSSSRESFVPLKVLEQYARQMRFAAGNSRVTGCRVGSLASPGEKYLEFEWDEKWTVDYRAFLKIMHAFDRLGQVERCVANSQYTAKYLADVYGRECDEVVYPGTNAVDSECRLGLDLPDGLISAGITGDDYFLAIGQLHPRKRIDLILEAVARTSNAKLCVAGTGPEKNRLQRTAKDLGVEDRVVFLDGLNNSELQNVLSRASGVIFTPIREPFGIVALEAMAAGKPLIGVNEGGFTELVHDTSGFLVPPDAEALAEKMCFVRDTPRVALNMGKAALHEAAQHSWDRSATELLHIVEDTFEAWPNRPLNPKVQDESLKLRFS